MRMKDVNLFLLLFSVPVQEMQLEIENPKALNILLLNMCMWGKTANCNSSHKSKLLYSECLCFADRDGLRESHIMTKTFDVEQLATSPTGPQDDGLNFMNDIPANEVIMLCIT